MQGVRPGWIKEQRNLCHAQGSKKTAKKLFKTADEKGIADKDKRNSVLSVIAYSLCAAFMNEKKLLTEVYDTIYRDISGKPKKHD